VLSVNSVLSLRTLNDLRFSLGQRKFDMTPNGLSAPVNIPGVAFLGRENILPHYRKERHVTVAAEKRAILAGRKGPALWLRNG
jgi:hypothetical protein